MSNATENVTREEVLFTCKHCGKIHTIKYKINRYGGQFIKSGKTIPYRMEGLEGEFCNMACAVRYIANET